MFLFLHIAYSSSLLKGNFLASLAPRRYVTLSSPVGICIDSNDILYVCDLGDHYIKTYTTEGQYLGKLCCRERFPDPKGIAVDKIGNIYVSDDSYRGALLVSKPY